MLVKRGVQAFSIGLKYIFKEHNIVFWKIISGGADLCHIDSFDIKFCAAWDQVFLPYWLLSSQLLNFEGKRDNNALVVKLQKRIFFRKMFRHILKPSFSPIPNFQRGLWMAISHVTCFSAPSPLLDRNMQIIWLFMKFYSDSGSHLPQQCHRNQFTQHTKQMS